SDQSWVAAPAGSVAVPGDITLSVDTSGMPPGQYFANIAAQIDGETRGELPVTLTVSGGEDRCAPVICSEIRVDLPWLLEFDSERGHLVDGNGLGTGFTYFDPPTHGTGYAPANLLVDPERGTLKIHTSPGIQY